MRWSAAYRASVYGDTADTADRNPVSADISPSLDTTEVAFNAEERAAIQAEGSGVPLAPTPHNLPTSWTDATIEPTAGARCRCCGGASWWMEATAPRGWRCSSCNPPTHLLIRRRRTLNR